MQQSTNTPGPTVLRGFLAIQYALQNPSAQLLRRGLFDRRAHAIARDTACWLAQRGEDGQIFVELGS